jgi:hypothetical protein
MVPDKLPDMVAALQGPVPVPVDNNDGSLVNISPMGNLTRDRNEYNLEGQTQDYPTGNRVPNYLWPIGDVVPIRPGATGQMDRPSSLGDLIHTQNGRGWYGQRRNETRSPYLPDDTVNILQIGPR